MEKGILGKRVKELRLSNGFSQEYLADESKLNLRTIQRIESGTTIPRGDTLSRLATALKVRPDELIEWSLQEDKGQLLLLNLSGLFIILNPIMGIIIPLVIWISKKDKILHADETGKKLLNFQISWLLFLCLVFILDVLYLVFFQKMDSRGAINSPVAAAGSFIILGFYYTYSIIVLVKNYTRIKKNMHVNYKLSFKFIK
jgi:transcriptional regulator with XRE-family HTH domain